MTFAARYALDPQDPPQALHLAGGSVLSLKVTGRESNGGVTVLTGVVVSGGPPLHVHAAEDEVVICTDGELAYRVGERRGVLEPGGLLWFPRGVPHAVANLSDAPARFVTVVTPGGIEEFFRAQRDYLTEVSSGRPFDPADLGSVRGHETRTVVGPPLG